MTRGKAWTVEEEAALKALVEAGTHIEVIAQKLGKQPGAITVKIKRLGIVTKTSIDHPSVTLPKDLPSAEDALRKLADALEKASTPGLDRVEVLRLQVVANLAKAYKKDLADYINYREIEARLFDMEAKYAQLLEKTGKTSKSDASKPDSTPVAKSPTQ